MIRGPPWKQLFDHLTQFLLVVGLRLLQNSLNEHRVGLKRLHLRLLVNLLHDDFHDREDKEGDDAEGVDRHDDGTGALALRLLCLLSLERGGTHVGAGLTRDHRAARLESSDKSSDLSKSKVISSTHSSLDKSWARGQPARHSRSFDNRYSVGRNGATSFLHAWVNEFPRVYWSLLFQEICDKIKRRKVMMSIRGDLELGTW